MNHFSCRWMAGLGVAAAMCGPAGIFSGTAHGQENPNGRRATIQVREAESDSDDQQSNTFDVEIKPADIIRLFGEAQITTNDEASERPVYWLGIEAEQVGDSVRSQFDLPRGQGLAIVRVMRGTPAARAGIRPHDILLSVSGRNIGRMPQLAEVVNGSPGREVAIKVLRDGRTVTLMATPAVRPAQPPTTAIAVPSGAGPVAVARRVGELRTEAGNPQVNWMQLVRPAAGVAIAAAVDTRPELPDNLSVDIHREGNKPARITIQKGNEKWEVTDDEWSKLPQSIFGEIAPLVTGGRWTKGLRPAPFPPGATPGAPGFGGMTEGRFNVAVPSPDQMREQMEAEQHRFADVAKNLQEIQRAIGQLAAHQQQAETDHRRIEELGRQLNEIRGTIQELREQRQHREAPTR